MRSTDYIRVKNVKLSYTLPQSLVSKANMKYVQVFFSTMNLFTWDTYKVFDPENSSQNGGSYPQRRLFNLGVNITL